MDSAPEKREVLLEEIEADDRRSRQVVTPEVEGVSACVAIPAAADTDLEEQASLEAPRPEVASIQRRIVVEETRLVGAVEAREPIEGVCE